MAGKTPSYWLMVEASDGDRSTPVVLDPLPRFCVEHGIGVLLRIDGAALQGRGPTTLDRFRSAGVVCRIYNDSVPNSEFRQKRGYDRREVVGCFSPVMAVGERLDLASEPILSAPRHARVVEPLARFEAADACLFVGDSRDVRRTLAAIAFERNASVDVHHKPPIAIVGAPDVWITTALFAGIDPNAKWFRLFEARQFAAVMDFLLPGLPAPTRR